MESDSLANKFRGRRVLVVGDPVADQFLSGTIARVSREAPVFILRHDETCTCPGGAANAAANIAALGGSATLIGIVGNDREGELLTAALIDSGVDTSALIRTQNVRTTTKLRVLAGQQFAVRQQVIRIDYEPEHPESNDFADKIRGEIAELVPSADAIIFSDYGYGSATPDIFADARKLAAKYDIPIVVDSRYRLGDFRGATAATPNLEEARRLLESDQFRSRFGPRDPESTQITAAMPLSQSELAALREFLGTKALVVTLGPKGMQISDTEQSGPMHLDAVGSKEPVDVTGAGDTVIAAFTLALAAGADYRTAASVANHAGGIVVMKKGTAVLSAAELAASLAKYGHFPQFFATSHS